MKSENFNLKDSKYGIRLTNKFKNQYKQIKKQRKNVEKLITVVEIIASGNDLDYKYKDHILKNDKYYRDCRECHIEPDWLLVYHINHSELILLLLATGLHSELFVK